MINRRVETTIESRLFKGKAIIILGPRQCGKSTLVEKMLKGKDHLYLNGDEADVREILHNTTSTRLKALIGSKKIVFIDEAQRITNVGLTIKLFTDQLKDVQVIATGSSAFDLSGQINEPLTGRKYEFMLYPISFSEMVSHNDLLTEKRLIEHRLLYGYYPEILNKPGEERELLKLLSDSYLYKDLLMLDRIKKPVVLEKLLKALALQIGNEVNLYELGQIAGADEKTIDRYLDLLERAFVVFRLPALSRNVRNEIKRGKKIYFYDCGIRNAIINDFRPFSKRADVGQLWENFVITERLKILKYDGMEARLFFWRTSQQQEIDLIEEIEQDMNAYEIKWGSKDRAKFPLTFRENYPNAMTKGISQENIEDILLSTINRHTD